jgi:hypothetical protein
LDVNVCASSDVSSNGLSRPTPPKKQLKLLLGEQLLHISIIVCKGKRPSHISKGFPQALPFGTVAIISILVVDLL